MELKDLCDAIQQGWEDVARLEKNDCDSRPGPPASAEAMERLLAAHGERLPADYLDFLRLHDGWEQITFGHILYSIDDLLADEHIAEIKEDLEEDLGEVLGEIIGILWSENDGHFMYIDPADGKIVEYCYEELDRLTTFQEYLEERLEQVEEWRADLQQQQAQLVRDLDPDFRNETEADVEKRAIKALAAHATAAHATAAAAPLDLSVVPAYVRRERWLETPRFKDDDGHVCLALSLYLAFAPTSDELRAALRAWRAWSGWAGPVKAGRYRSYSHTEPLDDPGDEAGWGELLDTDPADLKYGLVWIETEGGDDEDEARVLTIRVFSEARGEQGYEQAAPLCLATLPPDTDPDRLPDLATALVEALPVRSGIGGLQARYPRYPTRCYDWCRQHPGLDLQDPDMVFPPLREGLRGAGWLTVLGPALGRALEAAKPVTAPADVEVIRGADGALILRAGPAPDLSPITLGLPASQAAVDALVRPLRIGSASSAPRTRAFKFFEVTDVHYGPWLYRFEDPTRFLRHTAGELSQLAPEVGKQGREEDLVDLARLAAASDADKSDGLGSALYNAGCEASRRDLRGGARALYEACLELPDCPPQAYGNLIVCYNELGQLERACAFTEAHLGRRDPYIHVNGACSFCERGNTERGDTERALELLREGIALGFDRLESIADDPSLARLRDDPRFLALFE
jgi:Type VI immunity for VRR-NUC/SMI1 / KNR4 family (SUKH-1)